MKRIIKISGESGSGKSRLLQIILGGTGVRNCVVVDGQSSLQGILQLVRSRENVTLLIDECDPELLAELEAITEHSAVWGRIGCVYAVVADQGSQLEQENQKLNLCLDDLTDYMNEGCICGRAPNPKNPVDPRLLVKGRKPRANQVAK